MQIELWDIHRIRPYPGNPRLNDSAVDAVARSIQEFGFRQPIVVDANGVIICGHTRYKAAQKLGLDKVPVHVAKDLTPAQIKAYRIADNQTALLAEWDFELLPLEMADLKALDFNIDLLGFSPDEMAKIFRNDVQDG
ncbi:MAG: ParB N-terminal domain-containing protein, partial [Planctomycetaceae bacterium]